MGASCLWAPLHPCPEALSKDWLRVFVLGELGPHLKPLEDIARGVYPTLTAPQLGDPRSPQARVHADTRNLAGTFLPSPAL